MAPRCTIKDIGGYVDSLFNIDENDKEESINRNIELILGDVRSSLRSNIDTMSVQELIGLYGLMSNYLDTYDIGSQRVVLLTNAIMNQMMKETEWLSKANNNNSNNSQLVYVMKTWHLYFNIFKNTKNIVAKKIELSDSSDEIKSFDKTNKNEVFPIPDSLELNKYGTKISNVGLETQQTIPPPKQITPKPVIQKVKPQIKPQPQQVQITTSKQPPKPAEQPKPLETPKQNVRIITTKPNNIASSPKAPVEDMNIIEEDMDMHIAAEIKPLEKVEVKEKTIESIIPEKQSLPTEQTKPVEQPISEPITEPKEEINKSPSVDIQQLVEQPKTEVKKKATTSVKAGRGRPPKVAAPKTTEPVEQPKPATGSSKSVEIPQTTETRKVKFNTDELKSEEQNEEIV